MFLLRFLYNLCERKFRIEGKRIIIHEEDLKNLANFFGYQELPKPCMLFGKRLVQYKGRRDFIWKLLLG